MKKPGRAQILFLSGLAIILLMLVAAVFAPWISPQSPDLMSLKDGLQGPTLAHPLGLDENGSDVLAKLVYGARVSLGVAWSVILISGIAGLIIGSLAGYFGGWLEDLLMAVVDMVYAFPGFLLALALIAVLGPSLKNLIIALCLTSWTGFARLVRGEVLHLKEREYVQSARAMGATHARILVLHIWPNLLGLLIVQSTFAMAGTIISESGLSFLGLGVPPSTPTWGSLLNSGRRVLVDAPHVSFSAGLAIMTVVLGFNLLGDGLRDLLDPRQVRGRDRI
jgi:peptide/nickel transport system permease protein